MCVSPLLDRLAASHLIHFAVVHPLRHSHIPCWTYIVAGILINCTGVPGIAKERACLLSTLNPGVLRALGVKPNAGSHHCSVDSSVGTREQGLNPCRSQKTKCSRTAFPKSPLRVLAFKLQNSLSLINILAKHFTHFNPYRTLSSPPNPATSCGRHLSYMKICFMRLFVGSLQRQRDPILLSAP